MLTYSTGTLMPYTTQIIRGVHLNAFLLVVSIMKKKYQKKKTKKNKRPRGLGVLLGHFLVKRIPEMHKLSTTKIPEYLSQTVDTRWSKLEMHRMTPSWTWRLNSQKYSIYTKYLPLSPKFHPLRSTTSRFRDTRLSKIENAPSDAKLNLNT